MPLIIDLNGHHPQIDPSVWIADNATITGNVSIESQSSVWFQVVIRGDVNKISIGKNVNIQDGAIVHGTLGRGDTIIGDNVSIGHRAIVHGCTVHNNVLIGMGAIVLDDAILQEHTIVAAGAVVTSNSILESGFLYAGIPAKKIKAIDENMINQYINGTAQGYIEFSSWYRNIRK